MDKQYWYFFHISDKMMVEPAMSDFYILMALTGLGLMWYVYNRIKQKESSYV